VTNMDIMFYNASVFNQDISSWCVSKITSRPGSFDSKSGFKGQTALQPQWGTCPVRVTKEPVIQASTGGFGPVDAGDGLILQSTGITDPNGSLSHRWQRETVAGSDTFVDIAGQTGISYTTTQTDSGLAVRLVETHTLADGRTQDIPSNEIGVDDSLPVDPTRVVGVQLTSGTLSVRGLKTNGGIIYHVDSGSTVYTIAPGSSFYTTVSDPGLYLIESDELLSLNFWGSKNVEFVLDTRSYTSDIQNAGGMFRNCNMFNQDLSWMDTSNVTSMGRMFYDARVFNGDVSTWDTSKVTNMYEMFRHATVFNSPINSWNTSNLTNIDLLFYEANAFNQPMNDWDVSNVTTLYATFEGARKFNQPLGNWNISNVTNLNTTFESALVFNQDLNSWDTTNVTDMYATFMHCFQLNYSLDKWDTSKVSNMRAMFSHAAVFAQDLSGWCVPLIGSKPDHFDRDSSPEFKDHPEVQPKWGTCPSKITSNPVIY